MLKVKKFFIIFLAVFIITNTILVDEVQANAWAFTMAELLAESAGTAGAATLGSSALGIIVPVLVGIAVIYAGYEIVTHREEIWATFKGWYETASPVVENWINSIAQGIENGTIKEGDEITIPQNVLEASKGWVQEYSTTISGDAVIKLDGNSINTYEINFSDSYMNIIKPYAVTYAPVIVSTASNGEQGVYFAQYATGAPQSTSYENDADTLIINVNSYGTFFQYCNWYELNNGLVSWYESVAQPSTINSTSNSFGTTSLRCVYNYGSNQYDQTNKEFNIVGGRLPAGNVSVNSNTLSSANWIVNGNPYTLDILIPKTCGVVLLNNVHEGVLSPSNFTAIATPNAPTATNDFTAIEAEYAPNYETNYTTGAIGLSIPLTPDVVNKVGEYIGTTTPETDLISTLDPVGIGEVIVDNPTWLDGLLEGLIGGLQDLLEWLFVPSDAFIDEYVAHCESVLDEQAGILTYPITLVIRFLNEVLLLGETDCIFHLPPIVVFGYTIYTGEDYNFTEEVHRSEFAGLYNVYMTVTDYIMIIAVMSLAIKKGQEIIRGN